MRLFQFVAIFLALVPLVLLGVTRSLQPASAGLGTHQQLGLPPCSMQLMLGVRCPSCGMTTSWSHFTRGQFYQSFLTNPGGFLLAIFSVLFAVISLRTGITGELPSVTIQRLFSTCLIGIAVVTCVDWCARIASWW